MPQRDAIAGDQGFGQLAVEVEILRVTTAVLLLPDMAQNWTIFFQRIKHFPDVTDHVLVLLPGKLRDLAAGHGDGLAAN